MIGDDVIDGSGVDAEVDVTNWPWGSHWGATKVLFPSAGHPSGDVNSNTCKKYVKYLFPLSSRIIRIPCTGVHIVPILLSRKDFFSRKILNLMSIL